MATRNVVLSQHQHELVEALVQSGRYQNASEVLRAGLRLVERQEVQDALVPGSALSLLIGLVGAPVLLRVRPSSAST